MADAKAEFLLKVVDEASKELKLVNKNLEDMEKNAKALDKMRQGALVMGGAMAVGLGLAVNQAIKFESALAPVKSVLTGTAAEVQAASARIGSAAMEWSSRYSQSSEEFLQASYNMLSAGLNEVQALAGTQQALALATATMGDASTASQLMGTLYNNFADKTRNATAEMTMLSDVVTKTQQAFQIANLGQLNEGLKYAAASAQAFKVSFMQTSAVVGQLNTLGLSGSMAGTAFNAMMAKLNEGAGTLGYTVDKTADGGIDLVKTLENVKKVGADADTLNKVFGQEGAKGIILLTEKIGDLQKNYELVKNSAGATAAAQKVMEDTPAVKMTIALHKLAAAGTKIGAVFLPPLTLLLSGLGAILDSFNWLLDVFPPLRIAVGALIALLAVTLTIFGSWVFWTKTAVMWQGLFNLATIKAAGAQVLLGIKSMAAGLMSAGAWAIANAAMIAATLGISAAIAGFIWLVQHIDNVRAGWDNLKNNLGVLQFIFAPVIAVIDAILWGIKKIAEGIQWLSKLGGKKDETNAIDIANSQKQATETLPAQKAMPASKVKIPKSSPSSSETDWGMNSEFLAANGLGGGVKPSAKTIDTVRAGVQNVTHNKGGAVDNSRSIHIANITIDGANITDFETFKLELSAAVGGMT